MPSQSVWPLSLFYRNKEISINQGIFSSLVDRDEEEERSLEVIRDLVKEITFPKEKCDIASPEERSVIQRYCNFVIVRRLIALYSSFLFAPAAYLAGKRFAEKAPKELIEYVGLAMAVASSVTNSFFSERELDRLLDYHSFQEWAAVALKEIKDRPFTHMFRFASSFATLLPYLYVNFTSKISSDVRLDIAFDIFIVTSAAPNIIVYYSEPVKLMDYAELERFTLRCQWLFNAMVCADLTEINKKIELTKIKSLLVTHFLELADNFRMANEEQQQAFLHRLQKNKENTIDVWPILLGVGSGNQILPYFYNPVREETIYWFLKYVVLGLPGMLQNFGHAMESYRFGAQFHWALGVLFAFLNLYVGVKFTCNGIVSLGLVELFFNPWPSKDKSWKNCCTWMSLWTTFVRICFLFSGPSGNQLNYDSATYVGANILLATIIGFLSGFGTFAVFNLPQGEKILAEMQQPGSPSEIQSCQKKLDELPAKVREFSLKTIETLIYSNKTRSFMTEFFKKKNFSSPILENLDCKI